MTQSYCSSVLNQHLAKTLSTTDRPLTDFPTTDRPLTDRPTTDLLMLERLTTDLAGQLSLQSNGKPNGKPNILHVYDRIHCLVDRHLSLAHLDDRLEDLPHQFVNPQPRHWRFIDWHAIEPTQVVGIDFNVFLRILSGTIATEAPIRDYTQASRQYLEPLYPQMAQFVGGKVDETGRVIDLGLWEKEERQHAPALVKIYTRLAGYKPDVIPHQARSHQPADDVHINLYRHGLNRVATEYGATCLYLWMMAHTTGQLQAVLAELLKDEINHMTKFWGFGVWAFPETGLFKISRVLTNALMQRWQDTRTQGSLLHTLHRMMAELHWSDWSGVNKLTFVYTFAVVMRKLWQWHHSLTPDYLDSLFETTPF